MVWALTELDISVRYALFFLANVVLVVWTYKVIASAKAGWTRFLFAQPMFVLCFFIFTLFDYEQPSERAIAMHTVMVYLWLIPWKISTLCLNRGCLTRTLESGNLKAFVFALLLDVDVAFEIKPITQDKKSDETKTIQRTVEYAHDDVRFSLIEYKSKAILKELLSICGRTIIEILLMFVCAYLYKSTREYSLIKSWYCMWFIYGYASAVRHVTQLISLLVLNIATKESFNKPFLAESFTDFWSRRWNLIMVTQLRELCYEPIIQAQWIAPRKYLTRKKATLNQRLMGIFLTFFASAVIHLVIIILMFPEADVPIRFTSVFILTPFFIAFELLLKLYIQRSNALTKLASCIPKVLKIVVTHIGLLFMIHFLFLPDLYKVGFYDKSMEYVLGMISMEF